MTEIRFGNCRVVEVIGQGPLTIVYRAVQEPIGRVVAVKALRGTIAPTSPLAAQLEREAHLLAGFHHEGILDLHDFVRTDESMWLVLEHVDGVSLAELLDKAPGGLPPSVAIAIALGALDALRYAHDRGVVHRDVKPSNLLIGRDGRVKLADFGIAHDDRLPSSPEPVEGSGGFGTPQYMSPEQVLGEPIDARSDIFSLGVVLYQMLAGVRPFEAPDARATTQRIRHDAPTPLSEVRPDVPPPLERVVARCLEKRVDDRSPTSASLIEELLRAADEIGLAPSPRDVAESLVRAGLVTEVAESPEPSPRPPAVSAPRDGVGSAALGQLFVLLLMVVGGGAIQSNAEREGGPADRGGDTLELLPDRAASLRVIARPWAQVYVDGQLVDTTPFARPIPLRAGEHDVTFRHPVAPEEHRQVKVAAGENALVEVEMKVPDPPRPETTASAAPTSSTP